MLRFPCVLVILYFLTLPQTGLAQTGMGQTGMAQPGLAQGLPISREQLDLTRLLPPPPAPDSPEQKREIATLLDLQQHRTSAEEAVALADSDQTVFRFADVFGPDFTEGKLPKTAALFAKATGVASFLVPDAQKHWNRARPFVVNPDIKTCLVRPKSPSYPSGNATFGTLAAVLLTAMVPEKQAAIFQRAQQYGHSRLIGGVHYPSDVTAGNTAGTVIAVFLLRNPAFKAELEDARAELRGVLGMQ